MKKTLLLIVMFCGFVLSGFSQADKFWSPNSKSIATIVKDKSTARLSYPKEFQLFDFNSNLFRQQIFKVVNNAQSHSTVITLPNASGSLERFEIVEASNFEPALQAKYPNIRAFSGTSLDIPGSRLKLSYSPGGISAMVFRNGTENEFVEAYSQDHSIYAAYKSQRVKGSLPWTCTTDDVAMFNGANAQIAGKIESNTGELKTMRLAQSCNGEYATFFGAAQTNTTAADTALVLAAFNATLTRCNGVYENDLALHLNLIPETGNVIYFNPTTDPYTTLANWNNQLQTALTANIGDALYDIGHMFGASGGGGNAGCIGCVCSPGIKGRGITSPADGIPMGDNFDIDYVAHEVGHQLGGNHTFSHSNEGSGVNKEVGSGITVMGYAGITGQDVAPHSIDIFHETSIQQIQNNLATKTCPITTNITATNATPVVAALTARTIPISTPFYLTGSATDANAGDVLTYTWEQDDNGTGFTGNNSVAFPTKLGGPNWITFKGTTNPTRLLPRLSTILAGNFITPTLGGDAVANTEALSSVGRVLNFRLTVRDNSPYSSTPPLKVGQTAFANVAITVTPTSGPFRVTVPNTNVNWPGGSSQTITWDVANTTLPPVSCANVMISLSTDGGQTFPTVLAASTPNDGSETVTIPSGATTTARIKIESVGNIFFDIDDANFTISAPVADYTLSATSPVAVTCAGAATATSTLSSAITGGFSTPITLSATGVPAGTTVTFANNPLTPGNSTTVTLNNANTLASGSYTVTIQGNAGGNIKTTTITFNVSTGAAIVFTTNPANQTVCAGSTATFTSLAPGTVTYQWQVSTNGGTTYTNIAGATNASYTTAATTTAMNGNLYRVIATSQCATGTSTAATLTVQSAPAITTQPTNQTACNGSAATFTVAATGAGLTYQWQVSTTGCAGVFSNIAGANSASYTTAPVGPANNGYGYRVIVSGTCPSPVTSACATLTVGDAAAITSQPSNVTVCAGANATFSVTATGSSLTYQWQISTDGGTTFTNIAGATAATYTVTGTTPAMNNNRYRVIVFSCTPTGVTSNAAILTVNTPISISAQPTDLTICQGTAANFSVTAAGTGIAYQWQYSATGCAGTFTNIAGATSATYSIAAPTPANNGGYRVIVSGTCGNVTSNCATLTVNVPVAITAQPQDVSVCVPTTTTATFNVTATGTGLTYQWQVSTNGGTTYTNIAGATATSYTVNPVTPAMNGNRYRVIVSGTCTPAGVTSTAAVLSVNSVVNITQQPMSISTCTDSVATFTVVATGATITYQWQVSVNGGPFTNLSNTSPYSGVNTATLTISPLNINLSGNQYRVIVSGVPCGSVTSNAATLTVNNQPTVILTAASFGSSTPYTPTGLYLTISPAGSYHYVWYKDGVLLPTVTSASLPITPDDYGTYYVIATNDATGCAGRSNTVTVSPAPGSGLYVYPNPNNGNFQVRVYSPTGTPEARMVNVYDSKGSRVYSKEFTVGGPYGRMDVSLNKVTASEIYVVEVVDASGKRIAASRFAVSQ